MKFFKALKKKNQQSQNLKDFFGLIVAVLLLDHNLRILWSCSFFEATYIKFWSYWDDEGWIFV